MNEAELLSHELMTIEDSVDWEYDAMLRQVDAIETRARDLGDDLLVHRALLSRVHLFIHRGDVEEAAHRINGLHEWAVSQDQSCLHARVHRVWASVHRLRGNAAQYLEHSLSAVELLDDTATSAMQVWHRAKLADALAFAGLLDEARRRYTSTENLAIKLNQPHRLLSILNNHAYAEYSAGSHEEAQRVADRLQTYAAAHGLLLDPATLDTIASIQIETGRYAEAEAAMFDALTQYAAGKHVEADALAEYHLTLARAQRCRDALNRAAASLDTSRRLCEEGQLPDVAVRIIQEDAELLAARGDFVAAFTVHKQFVAAHQHLVLNSDDAQAQTRQVLFEAAEARRDATKFRDEANHDPLTSLGNRRFVEAELERLIEHRGRFTVALIDLDHFKQINDRFSHDVGDLVLVSVAGELDAWASRAGPGSMAARIGGEEFLLLLPSTNAAAAAEQLDQLRHTVKSQPWDRIADGLTVTMSIGLAEQGAGARATRSELVAIADRHLYAAKHAGRDRVWLAGT